MFASYLAAILLTAIAVTAQTLTAAPAPTYSLDASQCASPSGYNSCDAQINTNFNTCVNNAGGSTDGATACASAANLLRLGCIYESCWNIVSLDLLADVIGGTANADVGV